MRTVVDVGRVRRETRGRKNGGEDREDRSCLRRNRDSCRRDDQFIVLVVDDGSRRHQDGEWDI